MEYMVFGGKRFRVQSADASIRENNNRLVEDEYRNDPLAQFCATVEKNFRIFEQKQKEQFAEWKRRREERKAKNTDESEMV